MRVQLREEINKQKLGVWVKLLNRRLRVSHRKLSDSECLQNQREYNHKSSVPTELGGPRRVP